ncbi:Alpha/Beta hydrolase protein [Fomitopsis serialis]|uniref:Alpha/Beta hydrolase protein n=1 Tax=Fomitopsis serialis TaxID=139415 RepID=UPI0020078B58|nr:Alpha/Beta hydrolase protein [Neoantrodia serialis]KAH9934325.1 Alpha/Beta hydrolase protein [Neoantrodia serialis]
MSTVSALRVTAKTAFSSDGTPIYAEAIGDSHKPAVVMAHGMALSAAIFDKLFYDKRMLDCVYMIRYDLRGHGRSGKPTAPEAYVSSLWANDYVAVMQAFGVTKHPTATVACDVCANINPNPLSGIIFVSPLPYVGPIMGVIGTSTILGFLDGLSSTTDVNLHLQTKIDFVNSLVNKPEELPFDIKSSLLGQALLHPPGVDALIVSRPQDPAKLFTAGEQGLPMLLIHGTADTQVMGQVVERELSPYFVKLEARAIQGGCHALSLEFLDEVVEPILKFMHKVAVRDTST